MPRWVNLPNTFTLARIVLVPFIVQAIVTGRHGWALLLFVIAAVTDLLDGASARGMAATTQAGAYFDPIADKCLLSSIFLALAAAEVVPWWLVIIVLGRDLYILAGVAVLMAFTQQRKFPPSVWGKASTFVQIATVVVWMTANALPAPWLRTLAVFMRWPCAAVTIWSGIHYTWKGIQFIRVIDARTQRE